MTGTLLFVDAAGGSTAAVAAAVARALIARAKQDGRVRVAAATLGDTSKVDPQLAAACAGRGYALVAGEPAPFDAAMLQGGTRLLALDQASLERLGALGAAAFLDETATPGDPAALLDALEAGVKRLMP